MTELYEQFLDYTPKEIINIIKENELYTPAKIKKHFQKVYNLSDEEIWCKQENKIIKIYFQSSYANIYEGTSIKILIDKSYHYYNKVVQPHGSRENMTLRQCYKKADRIINKKYDDKHFKNYSLYEKKHNPNAVTYNVSEYRFNKNMINSYKEDIARAMKQIESYKKDIQNYQEYINKYKEKNCKLLKGKCE